MSEGITPLTAPLMHAAANESIEAMFRQGCDLERKLAEARTALDLAAAMPTHQGCPVENHGIVVAAMEALARIDGMDHFSASNTTSAFQG